MDSARPRRIPNKSRRPDWREELRKNCLERVKNERLHLLRKVRTQGGLPAKDMKTVESVVRSIISDEVQKLKKCVDGKEDRDVDMIWEYQGPQAAEPAEFDSEDILLEMERLLYEDLREELIQKEIEALDEEDAYLAQAAFDQMHLNEEGAENAKLWCPVCKQGELREARNLIHCTLCEMRLDLGEDKVNLDFLRERLANAHVEHLDRGCTLSPKFCLQTMFGLSALYIQCDKCNTFDVVV